MGNSSRKEIEKKARRDLILTSARVMLMQKGFMSTTMQDIAESAELAVGTLYLYFKDKETIFEELYLEGMQELHRIILEADGREGTPGQRLEEMGRAYLRFYREQKPLYDVVSYFFSFPEVQFKKTKRRSLAARGKEILRVVEKAIADGVGTGDFSVADPVKESLLLWSSLYGILQLGKMKDVLFKDYSIEDLCIDSLRSRLENLRTSR